MQVTGEVTITTLITMTKFSVCGSRSSEHCCSDSFVKNLDTRVLILQ